MTYPIISSILSIVCFIIILLVGLLTSLLREENRVSKPYARFSFSRVQLWLWTLVIIPLFALNWGFVNSGKPFINETSLVLLGISGASTLTSAIITAVHLSNGNNKSALKVGKDSKNFFYDILTDDHDQFSIGRLQNFVFTLVFIVIYVTYFFSNGKVYIDFNPLVYTLMGISAGTYLFAKALFK